MRRKIGGLRNFLIAGTTAKEQLDYTFDATPDPVLDKDPGTVSGDCTAGDPLPFDDPEIPVYNVKVYDSEKKHVGNIYLLVTSGVVGDKKFEKIWHLDAIQTPSRIDWGLGIEALLQTLAAEAEKSGVEVITVNTTPELISNFDHVRTPFLDYIQRQGAQEIKVSLPSDYDAKYSPFQGDGHGFILWR